MSKHTPTPWHKTNPHDEPYYEIWYGKIGAKDRELIAEYVSKDNAEFIVKACNSHAELYEAAQEMITALNGTYLDDKRRAKEHLEQVLAKVEKGE